FVQGFLPLTGPDGLKLPPLSLAALLDGVVPVVQPGAERAGVELVIESSGVADLHGDPAMLRQALLNLALNACQAMPDGGTLRIACHPASRGRVQIDVEDTGVGIPPENLQKIFDLYFTTKERGSGIGLSMVYRIVQLHDGEV